MNFLDKFAEEEGFPDGRFMPIIGDYMEPTARRGDWAVVVPVDRWMGEGLYVLDSLGNPVIYRADQLNGIVRFWTENPIYGRHQNPVRVDKFMEMVLGRVIALIKRC